MRRQIRQQVAGSEACSLSTVGHDDPVVQIASETDIECLRQVALLPHVELTSLHQRLAVLTAARLAS